MSKLNRLKSVADEDEREIGWTEKRQEGYGWHIRQEHINDFERI